MGNSQGDGVQTLVGNRRDLACRAGHPSAEGATYTANTPYNWDPVRQCKINVDKNTWRNDPFYELKTMTVYSNWARSPIDAGPRESIEQIEATGLRYQVLGRVANQSVMGWQAVRV